MLAALEALRKDSDLYIDDKAIEIRNDERESRRWTREYKTKQRQNTSEYKALFEAASRAPCPPIKDAKIILNSY
jgi:hypothetical protein